MRIQTTTVWSRKGRTLIRIVVMHQVWTGPMGNVVRVVLLLILLFLLVSSISFSVANKVDSKITLNTRCDTTIVVGKKYC